MPLYKPFKMAPKSKTTAPLVSKHKTNDSTARKSRSRLLGIPTELREHVYGAILNTSPSSLYNLLLTNRQISRESKPYLFKQSLVFDGQSELYEWLRTVDHAYLRLVVDMRFKLHDIDPEGIIGALGKRLRQAAISDPSNRPDKDPYTEACQLEIGRLEKAFRLLPNVKHFTILATTKADPQPPYRMLSWFSEMLVMSFPNLMSLTSYEDMLAIPFVYPLDKLRRLRFPGISTSMPAQVTSVLSEMQSLVELEVCRPDPTSAERKILSVSGAVERKRCDVADIIRNISELETLAFYEIPSNNDYSEAAEEEMTETIMDSISALERHKPSLRNLTILIDLDFEPWMQKKIATFIKSSRITHLETFDTDCPPLGYLPATIEAIVLRSGVLRVPLKPWLEKLIAMAQHYNDELPYFTETVIYLKGPPIPSDDNLKRWASKEMRKLGIQLWWRRWDGTPPEH